MFFFLLLFFVMHVRLFKKQKYFTSFNIVLKLKLS